MTPRKYAPVVLFVFNRLSHTQQTVAALQQNLLAGQTELFVYADAARNEKERKEVDEVRNYVRQITGFARLEVTERDTNRGLAENIIAGVTEVLSRPGDRAGGRFGDLSLFFDLYERRLGKV